MSSFIKARFLKSSLMSALLLTAVTPAFAQSALPDKLKSCAMVEDDSKRLACYDAAISDIDATVAAATQARKQASILKTKQLAEKAEADRLAALATAEKAKVDNFGIGSVPKEARTAAPLNSEIDSLEGSITEILYTGSKKVVIALDNGQMWRQTSSESTPILRVGDKVEIKRGILGSFRLKFLKQGRMVDVLRVR
jgi:hypothetical protein